MTPQQIDILKSSWAKVVPIKDTAAELFYGKLFELDPAVKPLFKGDMKEQGRKLMAAINTVVNGVDNLGPMVPVLQDMGKRHVAYGVTDAHYDTVGAALIWTLGQGLGDAFTPDVKEVWVGAYTTISGVMKEAAATA
ncbi:globin family protein [Methyloversatilis discipulorum]|uniref:globin family protein n=1 Tax=Methyloversatilis discipulorum TaxID=1119528 RepID=UPI001A476188|nr:globin family protein [Methyloversatilis discipulorum]MBL8468746.1 hemin receptor [Methyloversatilis discipulorum]